MTEQELKASVTQAMREIERVLSSTDLSEDEKTAASLVASQMVSLGRLVLAAEAASGSITEDSSRMDQIFETAMAIAIVAWRRGQAVRESQR